MICGECKHFREVSAYVARCVAPIPQWVHKLPYQNIIDHKEDADLCECFERKEGK